MIEYYPFEKFNDALLSVQQDNFQNTELVVFGSEAQNFLIAFNRQLADGALLDFSISNGKIIDNEGNEWNLFGEAIAGPRTGEQLTTVDNFIGYWFAFGAFYPELEVF